MPKQDVSITRCFADLPDPRIDRTKKHSLGDILAIDTPGAGERAADMRLVLQSLFGAAAAVELCPGPVKIDPDGRPVFDVKATLR